MKTVKFKATKKDGELISKIVDYAIRALKDYGEQHDRLSMEMDITACHLNGCPLELEKLSEFDDPNLLHDVMGISRYLDRDTGKLTDCFFPRSALREQVIKKSR